MLHQLYVNKYSGSRATQALISISADGTAQLYYTL